MTKIVGLTGGIGSGKSTIAKFFEALDVPVYYADEEAKKILNLPETVTKLVDLFGEAIIARGGLPDRAKIAEVVFNDKVKLEMLNKIIHPGVAQHFDDWVKQQTKHPYVIKEAAILFESGSYKNCDFVITVTAPIETRIERVITRDNVSRQQVLQRMENQWHDDKKISLSDFIITNISLEDSKKQVVRINDKIIM
ncbi:dephospho-CoA kinase [Flavobacterium rhizosphaerae]|uniref:Dephospho-CoA kinase n=1 Tax=Flavobacterium rhizosphaerae TaxID=3163298 RepID=A0ABW8YXN4_9FLAO